MPKRAFKKPNTKLLKAIAFIERERQTKLTCYSLTGGWYSFKVNLAFPINSNFWAETKGIFNKNLICINEGEVTFYLKNK